MSQRQLMHAIFVWFLAALFYFYDNLLQIAPTVMKPELSQVFITNAEDFGSLSAWCLYAYGIMQLPVGLLMDRFGPRRLIVVAALLCALGSFIFGLANQLLIAKFARLIIGVGASFALVSCLKLASIWFPKRLFGLMTGVSAMVGFLGAVCGLQAVGLLVESLGWREALYLGGIVGLGLSIILLIFIRDSTPWDKSKVVAPAPTLSTLLNGLQHIIANKNNWYISLYAGLMFVPTLTFGGLWGVPFLMEAHHLSRQDAGVLVSFIYIGWVIGAPSWGYISDRLAQPKFLMASANMITLITVSIIIYQDNLNSLIMMSLMLLLGLASSGFILAFPLIKELNLPQYTGTALGFINAINTFWGAIMQPIIGILLDKLVPSTDTDILFDLVEYRMAFLTIPASLVIAIILLRQTDIVTNKIKA